MKLIKTIFTKFEKTIYISAFILLVLMPVAIVYNQATLSKYNVEIETLKNETNNLKEQNEGLVMKSNELVSLDKINEVANNYGLTYNYDNIKNID